MIARPHYHLAKKMSKRENLYYVSQLDLVSNDTLYYVFTKPNFSLLFALLYLNIQNIDLKKQNLTALFLHKAGGLVAIEIPRLSEDFLDKVIIAYKEKQLLDIPRLILPQIDEINFNQTKFLFDFQSYINKLFYDYYEKIDTQNI